jgi:hypothetical protein
MEEIPADVSTGVRLADVCMIAAVAQFGPRIGPVKREILRYA